MIADHVRAQRGAQAFGSTFERLATQVGAAMTRYRVPGAAVGLVAGEDEQAAGFGITNVEHPLSVDAATLFQVGGLTRLASATAALRLVDTGVVDLDAPVARFLPAVPSPGPAADRLSLRDLLCAAPGGPPEPQSSAWLRAVLAAVGGRPYEALVADLVLAPLGMTHSFFFAADAITHRVAAGHAPARGPAEAPRVLRPWTGTGSDHPAGGLISSLRDQLRLLRFHLGDGRAPDGAVLLTPAMLALMQTPQGSADAGIPWVFRTSAATRLLTLHGAANGQAAACLLVPERAFALAVLTNSAGGSALCDQLTRWALRHFLGLIDLA